MNILGISAYFHDSAACLVKDGEIIAAAQEERFTRKKNDYHFPEKAIAYCLDEGEIRGEDLDIVAFYDKPLLKLERILESYLYYAPRGILSFLKAMPIWLKQKLWIPDLIMKQIEGFSGEVIFPEHHESHAASAFYPSPFERSAILTLDGVGEWATASKGVGSGSQISISKELHFPHSLGLLYAAFTYYTGFKVNSGEYKVMGLAPYGEPKYMDTILGELVDLKDDGSFRLNMRYFDFAVGLKMTNRRFERLFGGPPRTPESEITQKEMDLARSIQEVTETIVLRMAKSLAAETGESNLCMAGGVALNCVANGRILSEKIFENMWVQPAAGDAGGAMGAALLAWYQYSENPRETDGQMDFQKGSYLGPFFRGLDIERFLRELGASFEKPEPEELIEKAADLISAGKVVGWFQGRMEFGPRALGARSILGDARSPDMQSIMNLKIKRRESFRPFAPSVLREKASQYFEMRGSSPYMLFTVQVQKNKRMEPGFEESRLSGPDKVSIRRSVIPAVIHVDGSSRVHTVDEEQNSLYHKLISRFEEKTGCPVIINTSFNIRDEPIVCSPPEAYRCFMRTEMDCLVLGPFLLVKDKQPPWADDNKRQDGANLD